MTERLAVVAAAVLAPLTDPVSRTWWPTLLLAACVALVVHRAQAGRWSLSEALGFSLWRTPSARMDVQLFLVRRLLGLLRGGAEIAGGFAIATRLVMWLDAAVGRPQVPAWTGPGVVIVYSLVLFVAWDASRYALHRLMHEVPVLWELHQVHHSAEVLTPMTFHRLHPLEGVLYAVRGAVVTGGIAGVFYWAFRDQAQVSTLFGVHALGVVLNAATGNLRHSHVWLRFPTPVERWLLSPAQHQIHHSADPADHGMNYGTWLAVWDRLGGSLRTAGPNAPARLGVAAEERNHAPDDVLGALLGPLWAIGRRVVGRRAFVGGAALLGGVARAQEGGEPAPEPTQVAAPPDEEVPTTSADDGAPPGEAERAPPANDDDLVILVETRGGVPRVAGSAHVVGQEELERDEHTDIHRVLSRVPGVYTRGEDGFGLRPNIGIRGANSDRSAKITLTEDGVLFGPAPYAAPAAYYFPMSTRMVGVEVFKGPAATRFGPSTVGGAINLLTRRVPDALTGGLDVAYGMRNTVKLHGFGGSGGERWGVLAEGVHLGTDGFKQLDGGGPTGFSRQEAMVKFALRSAADMRVRHGLELKLGVGHERSNETYLGLSRADFEATPLRRYAATQLDLMRWHRAQTELAWTVDVGRAVSVRTVAYHHFLHRVWTKVNRFAGGPDLHSLLQGSGAGQAAVFEAILRGEEDSASPEQTIQLGTNDRTFHSGGVQSVARIRVVKGAVTSQTEIGLRLHYDEVRRLHTEDPFDMQSGRMVATGGGTLTLLDSHTTALAFAGHVHEDLGIGPVRLIPGARVEVIRTTSEDGAAEPQDPVTRAVVLPGLGIYGQATRWLDVFAGVHRGFSPVAPGQPIEVKPEQSWSYEAGARAASGETVGELVGFFNDYQNLTGQCTFSGGCQDEQVDQQYNGGKVFVYGLEASVGHAAPIARGVSLTPSLSYTWTGSRFRTGFYSAFPQFGSVEAGDALPYVPEHQGAVRLVLEHPRGSVTVAANARSAMRDVAGQGPIDEASRIPAQVMLDLAADLRVTREVTGYLTITNLTNSRWLESWRPFGARPSAPLQLMLGVKVAPGARMKTVSSSSPTGAEAG